jgi:hypothetical protein
MKVGIAMKTVYGPQHAQRAGRQRVTNMEKLAPGFADPPSTGPYSGDGEDKVTLVLARDFHAFTEWRQGRSVPLNRLRYVTSAQDLHGYTRDSVEVVELPDWHMSMSYDEHQRVFAGGLDAEGAGQFVFPQLGDPMGRVGVGVGVDGVEQVTESVAAGLVLVGGDESWLVLLVEAVEGVALGGDGVTVGVELGFEDGAGGQRSGRRG